MENVENVKNVKKLLSAVAAPELPFGVSHAAAQGKRGADKKVSEPTPLENAASYKPCHSNQKPKR